MLFLLLLILTLFLQIYTRNSATSWISRDELVVLVSFLADSKFTVKVDSSFQLYIDFFFQLYTFVFIHLTKALQGLVILWQLDQFLNEEDCALKYSWYEIWSFHFWKQIFNLYVYQDSVCVCFQFPADIEVVLCINGYSALFLW